MPTNGHIVTLRTPKPDLRKSLDKSRRQSRQSLVPNGISSSRITMGFDDSTCDYSFYFDEGDRNVTLHNCHTITQYNFWPKIF